MVKATASPLSSEFSRPSWGTTPFVSLPISSSAVATILKFQWARIMDRRMARLDAQHGVTQLDEALVKAVVGQGTVVGRQKFQAESFTFTPVCKLWITAKEVPAVLGNNDNAIGRRIREFDFLDSFSPNNLLESGLARHLIREEGEGIFAWAAAGARAWIES